MGLALLTAGVAFKIAAVPFHYWTPDAYQGSPTPVTGYLSVGPKVGAFALILRLFVEALAPLKADWLPFIVVLAALTMTLGNLVGADAGQHQADAGVQLHRPHRLHPGGPGGLRGGAASGRPARRASRRCSSTARRVHVHEPRRVRGASRRSSGGPGVTSQIATFAGLGRRAPLLGLMMTLFLLSLTGIPPTAGFFAKALIIIAAVQAGGWLAGAGRDHDAQRRRRPRSTTCASWSSCTCATRRRTRRRWSSGWLDACRAGDRGGRHHRHRGRAERRHPGVRRSTAGRDRTDGGELGPKPGGDPTGGPPWAPLGRRAPGAAARRGRTVPGPGTRTPGGGRGPRRGEPRRLGPRMAKPDKGPQGACCLQ